MEAINKRKCSFSEDQSINPSKSVTEDDDTNLSFEEEREEIIRKENEFLKSENESSVICIELPNNNKIYLNYQPNWTVKDIIESVLRSKEFEKLYPQANWILKSHLYLSHFDLELIAFRKIKKESERKIDSDITIEELNNAGFLRSYKTAFLSILNNRNKRLINLRDNKFLIENREFLYSYKDELPRSNSLYYLAHYPELEEYYQMNKSAINSLSKFTVNPIIFNKKDWLVYNEETLGFFMEVEKSNLKIEEKIKFGNNEMYSQDKLSSIVLSSKDFKTFLVSLLVREGMTIKLACTLSTTAREIFTSVNKKLAMMNKVPIHEDDVLLKVKNLSDYIFDFDCPFGQITHIHKSIIGGELVEYQIVPNPFRHDLINEIESTKSNELIEDSRDSKVELFKRNDSVALKETDMNILKKISLRFTVSQSSQEVKSCDASPFAIAIKNRINDSITDNLNLNTDNVVKKIDNLASYCEQSNRIAQLSQFFQKKAEQNLSKKVPIKLPEKTNISSESALRSSLAAKQLNNNTISNIKATQSITIQNNSHVKNVLHPHLVLAFKSLEELMEKIEQKIFEKISKPPKTPNPYFKNEVSLETFPQLSRTEKRNNDPIVDKLSNTIQEKVKLLSSAKIKGATENEETPPFTEFNVRNRGIALKRKAPDENKTFISTSGSSNTISFDKINKEANTAIISESATENRLEMATTKMSSGKSEGDLNKINSSSNLHKNILIDEYFDNIPSNKEEVLSDLKKNKLTEFYDQFRKDTQLSERIDDYYRALQFENIDIHNLNHPFYFILESIKLSKLSHALSNSSNSDFDNGFLEFFIELQIVIGKEQISKKKGLILRNSMNNPSELLSVNRRIVFNDIKFAQLPLFASILIKISLLRKKKELKTVGWINFKIFDHKDQMKTGINLIHIKNYEFEDYGYFNWGDGRESDGNCILLRFTSFTASVIKEKDVILQNLQKKLNLSKFLINESDKKIIDNVKALTPFDEMNYYDKSILWNNRYAIANCPELIPRLIQCIDFKNPENLDEIDKVLSCAKLLDPISAMQLLTGNYLHEEIRIYAVKCFKYIDYHRVENYLTQLIQALKYEPNHFSSLSEFLLTAAIKYPTTIGHSLFWGLKSEMHNPEVRQRFGLMLEVFLSKIGKRCCKYFENEIWLVDQLLIIADIPFEKQFKDKSKAEDMIKKYQKALQNLSECFEGRLIPLPINFKIKVKGIKHNKCKVMKSKKKPLWIAFENEDGEIVNVMFKKGDDLRQDILTLQLFKIMQSLWFDNNLNLKMSIYNVVATGYFQGMLEMVKNSETLATVHKIYGGATAAFSREPLKKWLEVNCTMGESEYIQNFKVSCSAYCIATFVLGVGDRHNDNIMIKRSGELFHIDFGHFLGHFKYKYGIKRERAPFIFTKEFKKVLGGKKNPQ